MWNSVTKLFLGVLTLLIATYPIQEGWAQVDARAESVIERGGGTANLRVMTFNMRYNNPGDGEHAWTHRKERVASVIRFHKADIVGAQEVLLGQIVDLERLLPEYGWFGVGRDDGEEAGEFAPIFYRKEQFDVLNQGVFWLSETPDVVGSVGWDAALPRIATWGTFRDRRTKSTFFLLNAHFDHIGEQARQESARLIVSKVKEMAGEIPVFVLGDFNVEASSQAYRVLAQSMNDAREHAQYPPHGPRETFWGFQVQPGEVGKQLDYIFVQGIPQVRYHGVLTDHWNGSFASDHLPVIVEISLP